VLVGSPESESRRLVFEAIQADRRVVLERWCAAILEQYPAETARFLKHQQDRFANPVGAAVREGLDVLLDGVLCQAETQQIEAALDRIVRVRAVQDMTAAQAVGFVLLLKQVVRSTLSEDEAIDDRLVEGYEALATTIDELLLRAFNVYMACREQVFEIRVKDVRNRSQGVMERLNEWRARRETSGDSTELA